MPTTISGRPSPSKSATTGAALKPAPGEATGPHFTLPSCSSSQTVPLGDEHDLGERIGVEVAHRVVSVGQRGAFCQ